MWNRRELKARGKAAFKANYWNCVLVALILTALIGGGAAAGRDRAQNASGETSLVEELRQAPVQVLGVIGGALIGVSAIASAVKFLVFNPLEVGCKRFFLVNSDTPAELNELGYGFQNGYGNMVVSMFLRDLFTFLWALLFIIPGIVKSYSYAMVPYILAENPDLSGTEAIRISQQMMKGHKWRAFVLDLSFIGWYVLAVLTAGIAEVLWVAPYVGATDAELYKAIR